MSPIKDNQSNAKPDYYQSWLKFVDELYTTEIASRKNFPPFMVNLQGLIMLRNIENPREMGVPSELHSLFHIVTNVRLLEHLLKWFVSSRYSYEEIEDTCFQLMYTIFDNIQSAVDGLPKPQPFSFDPVCDKLRYHVRELLFLEGAFKKEILLIYWTLWHKLFINRKIREEELAFAKQTAKKSDPDSAWSIGYSFHLFLAGDADTALDILEYAGAENLDYIIHFADYYVDTNDWHGIAKIVPVVIKHAKEFLLFLNQRERFDFVEMVNAVFLLYVEETGDYDTFEKVLLQMLPYSESHLSAFFFVQKEYRKLMDFLQYAGRRVHKNDIIRVIQREDPESLLPQYHQAVKSAIARKNRQSYKEAVRYLKKLRTIYRKLKKEDTWDYYFSKLLEETRRLRAFQEECQRGKLIHVENETN